RDDEVHLVDDALLEILADRRDAASDADVARAGGFLCAAERLVEAADEVERGAALHLDGRVRVVREDERGHVIWRIVSPPSLPRIVGPRAAARREHVAAEDPRTDVLHAGAGEVVVGAGG